jgi:hypothetical protein
VTTANHVRYTVAAELWGAVADVMKSVTTVSSRIDAMRAQLTLLSSKVSHHLRQGAHISKPARFSATHMPLLATRSTLATML